MATKNQPVKEVRLGRIKAVIWRNPGSNGNGPLFNTTLARLYDPMSTVAIHLTPGEIEAILTKTDIAKTKKLRP